MTEEIVLSAALPSREQVELMPHFAGRAIVDLPTVMHEERFGNALFVQSVIGLVSRSAQMTLVWDQKASEAFSQSPISYPLLACLSMCTNVAHEFTSRGFVLEDVHRRINEARLRFDWFSEPKALICADHLGLGRQKELYVSAKATGIRPREHFEALVFPYVESRLATSVTERAAFRWRAALTSIVFELFENTELHGRTDWRGKVLQQSLRGLVFRDVVTSTYQNSNEVKCLEVGVFDCGVGYYARKKKTPVSEDVSVQEEWEVMHECLSTHLEDGTAPGVGKGQRGIGLYEVLRALRFLSGAIEIRTGRLHAYRSFLPGDLRVQMEPGDSALRPNMPKPVLLDYTRKYFSWPTEQRMALGTAVRVLVPLQ